MGDNAGMAGQGGLPLGAHWGRAPPHPTPPPSTGGTTNGQSPATPASQAATGNVASMLPPTMQNMAPYSLANYMDLPLGPKPSNTPAVPTTQTPGTTETPTKISMMSKSMWKSYKHGMIDDLDPKYGDPPAGGSYKHYKKWYRSQSSGGSRDGSSSTGGSSSTPTPSTPSTGGAVNPLPYINTQGNPPTTNTGRPLFDWSALGSTLPLAGAVQQPQYGPLGFPPQYFPKGGTTPAYTDPNTGLPPKIASPSSTKPSGSSSSDFAKYQSYTSKLDNGKKLTNKERAWYDSYVRRYGL